ncbi:hypothetical protein PHLCEN_2v4100 [Hermanssonia centrifuga]|uniref:30S ribosomal protein S17, chloroplastic n=1 Tax=Hermanssonia centrifuga TaxID=98765 RepID=A0A2R6Q2R1_9APHY|nr:hypothetical protein PHLCEN_2v4100 [Hermanssonia centrifuga]
MPPMSFIGQVTKVGVMKKTATVTVTRKIPHPKTGKTLERSKKYLTHDEDSKLRQHDTVVIRNCPPISARKRFTLEQIIRSPAAELDAMHAQLAASKPEAEMNGTPQVDRSLNP